MSPLKIEGLRDDAGSMAVATESIHPSGTPIGELLLTKFPFGSNRGQHSVGGYLLLLFALLVLINLIVILGNILVILAVYATAKLRNVTNIFIVSLATADLLLGVLVLPYALLFEILDVWIFGEMWCRGWLVTDVWISTASILNLCAISVDRYVAVTRPVKYRSIMTPRRARTIVAGVWIVSFLICFPPLLPQWNPPIPSSREPARRVQQPPGLPEGAVTVPLGLQRKRRQAPGQKIEFLSMLRVNGNGLMKNRHRLGTANALLPALRQSVAASSSNWVSPDHLGALVAKRPVDSSQAVRHTTATIDKAVAPTSDQHQSNRAQLLIVATSQWASLNSTPRRQLDWRVEERQLLDRDDLSSKQENGMNSIRASSFFVSAGESSRKTASCLFYCEQYNGNKSQLAGSIIVIDNKLPTALPLASIYASKYVGTEKENKIFASFLLPNYFTFGPGVGGSGSLNSVDDAGGPQKPKLNQKSLKRDAAHDDETLQWFSLEIAKPELERARGSTLTTGAAPAEHQVEQQSSSFKLCLPFPDEQAKVLGQQQPLRPTDSSRLVFRLMFPLALSQPTPTTMGGANISIAIELLTGCPQSCLSPRDGYWQSFTTTSYHKHNYRVAPRRWHKQAAGYFLERARRQPTSSPPERQVDGSKPSEVTKSPALVALALIRSARLVGKTTVSSRRLNQTVATKSIRCIKICSPETGAHSHWRLLTQLAPIQNPATNPPSTRDWQRRRRQPRLAANNDIHTRSILYYSLTSSKVCRSLAHVKGSSQSGANKHNDKTSSAFAKSGLRLLLVNGYCTPRHQYRACLNCRDKRRFRTKRQISESIEAAHKTPSSSLSTGSSHRLFVEPDPETSSHYAHIATKTGCALYEDRPYVIYSALGSFYIPMLIMIFFYSRIYLVASRAQKALQRGYMTTKWQSRSGHASGAHQQGVVDRVTLRIHRREKTFEPVSMDTQQPEERARLTHACEVQLEEALPTTCVQAPDIAQPRLNVAQLEPEVHIESSLMAPDEPAAAELAIDANRTHKGAEAETDQAFSERARPQDLDIELSRNHRPSSELGARGHHRTHHHHRRHHHHRSHHHHRHHRHHHHHRHHDSHNPIRTFYQNQQLHLEDWRGHSVDSSSRSRESSFSASSTCTEPEMKTSSVLMRSSIDEEHDPMIQALRYDRDNPLNESMNPVQITVSHYDENHQTNPTPMASAPSVGEAALKVSGIMSGNPIEQSTDAPRTQVSSKVSTNKLLPCDIHARTDRSQSCGPTPVIVVNWDPDKVATESQLGSSNTRLLVSEQMLNKTDSEPIKIQPTHLTESQGSGLSLMSSLPFAANQVRKQSMMLLSTLTLKGSQTLRRLSMAATHPVGSLLNRSKSRDGESDGSLGSRQKKKKCRKRSHSPSSKRTFDDYLMAVAGIDGPSDDEYQDQELTDDDIELSLSDNSSIDYSLLKDSLLLPAVSVTFEEGLNDEPAPQLDDVTTQNTPEIVGELAKELETTRGANSIISAELNTSPPSALHRQGALYERATSREASDKSERSENPTDFSKGLNGPGVVGLTAAAQTPLSRLIRAQGPRRRGTKRTSRWHAKRLHAETKAAKTVAIIIGGFIFCWLPFFTAYLSRVTICEKPDCVPQSLLSLFIWLGYLNSAINPVIYGLFSADFRHAFRNILCRCRFRSSDETVVVSVLVDSIVKSIL